MSKCIKVAVASWAAGLLVTVLPLSAQNGAAQQPGAQPAEAAAKRQGPGVRVGVVDVVKAVEQYQRYITLMNGLADEVEAKKQQLVALKKRMDELRAMIGAVDEESEEAANAMWELSVGRQQEDFLRKKFDAETQAAQDKIRVLVYRDLEKAIAKVAAQKGVELVMTRTPAPSVDDDSKLTRRDWNLLARAYEQQQIWFAAEQLDLTGDVIKLMQVPLDDATKPAGGNGNSRGGSNRVVANSTPSAPVRMQRTLKEPVEYRGVGLHSGKEIKITVRPAEAGTGVAFVRTDLDDQPVVRAHGANMKARQRRTCIQDGRAEVYTCEHLLAALYALGIDNAMVEIDGEEVPGLDGAAGEFFRGLRQSGSVDMRVPRQTYSVKQPIYVRDGSASIVALPGSGKLTIEYHLDYPSQKKGGDQNGSVPGAKQIVAFELSPENFERDIAPARTFVFAHEVEALRAAGLGKGATSDNTLVVGPDGPQANTLRWDDELARHKILDLIGDIANAGVDLDAHIIATRSGHGLNMALVQRILEAREIEQEQGEVPSDTGLDIRQILNLLPHRYPFLLIDRVIELDGFQRAVAIKNVTINEPFFQGHWPEQPIMPGVLQLEAMAQLAGVLLLRKLENTGKLAVLWSIDKVKLRGAVVPGDQLRIEVETIRAKPQVGHVRARCKVAGRLVAEAELKFTLVDA